MELVQLTPDHQYRHADGHLVPSVTSILRAAQVRPEPCRAFSGVRAGLQRGREVHRLTRAIDETGDEFSALEAQFDPADLSADNTNYVSAYRRFLLVSGYIALAWEKIVYHSLYDYAGRVDAVGWLGTERVLIDRKTDRSLHRAVWLQLGFYRLAWDRTHPTERIDRTFALVLREDTTFELEPNPLEPNYEPFCVAAIWMARWHRLVL